MEIEDVEAILDQPLEEISPKTVVEALSLYYPDIPRDAIEPVVRFGSFMGLQPELTYKMSVRNLSDFLCHLLNQRTTLFQANIRNVHPNEIVTNAVNDIILPLYKEEYYSIIEGVVSRCLKTSKN